MNTTHHRISKKHLLLGAFVLTVLPNYSDAETCPIKGIITQTCYAEKQTLTSVAIEKYASIAGALFSGNNTNAGWVANSTIKNNATLTGGTLTGWIINEGVLANFTFRGASIKGGTLKGTIINMSRVGGTLTNVRLAPDTKITGGRLSGTIAGDCSHPAILENVRIESNSHLSCVTIDKANVSIGENVITEGVISREMLKIGTIFPLSGSLAEYGEVAHNGALLAIRDLTTAGYSVEFVEEDTKTDPQQGVEVARHLIEKEKVQVLIGEISSGVTIAVAEQVSIPKQILQISPGSSSATITNLVADEKVDLLFRTNISDAQQGLRLASLAFNKGYTRVSLLYVDNAYGQSLSTIFTENFEKLGGRVVAAIPHHDAPAVSYFSELDQAKPQEAQALMVFSYPQHAHVYVKEAVDNHLFTNFLFASGSKSEELIKIVGALTLQGMCGTAPGVAKSTSSDLFRIAYQTEYGALPPLLAYAAATYDAIVTATLASHQVIAQGKTLTSLAIRDHLRGIANPPGQQVTAGTDSLKEALQWIVEGQEIDYLGASGEVDYDQQGDVKRPLEIWCYEGGEIDSFAICNTYNPLICSRSRNIINE